ncbi:MAG: PaaI family thioesterase [Bacteroidetes bacterium]|nr:PaaI family thioesterase [bacterium]NBP64854.1 PaaI family thioesterase [Bacteroidota bacterium]
MSIYHYYITDQGDLLHEQIVMNDESLIEMIYKNMEINRTPHCSEAKYYAKIGYEEIYLHVQDTPIVFKTLRDNILYMTNNISIQFNPNDLRFNEHGYLYHRSTIGNWARLHTHVTMQLSKNIEKWGKYYIYKDDVHQRVIEPLEKEDTIFLHPKPENQCFGCGLNNTIGLRMTFVYHPQLQEVETWFTPPTFMMGSLNVIHGGMVSLLFDETMSKVLTGMGIKAPTGTLSVRYLKPTYMDQELHITASLISEKGRKLELQASMYDQSKVKTASGTALFIKREQVNP